jgi:hypothetical protein
MFTLKGYFKIDFGNLISKLNGTAEKFTDSVTDLGMQFSKKLLVIETKDSEDGSTFRFVKALETDDKWLLRVTMLRSDGEPSYSLRFHDMKIVKHDVALGNTISQTLFNGIGVTYDKPPVNHTIHLSFGSYDIED